LWSLDESGWNVSGLPIYGRVRACVRSFGDDMPNGSIWLPSDQPVNGMGVLKNLFALLTPRRPKI